MIFWDWVDKKLCDGVDQIERKVMHKLDKVEENLNKLADKSITFGENIDIAMDKDYTISEKIDNIIENSKPVAINKKVKKGDIIGVDRGIYEHYGIYLGENQVIHFTSFSGNLSDNKIMITKMDHFFGEQTSIFVFNPYTQDKQNASLVNAVALMSFENNNGIQMKHYSVEETISRAYGELGKNDYNLVVNNCEHFAVWCKTGVHKSFQVDRVLKGGNKISMLA
jgi:hypothetical protein